MSDRDDAAMSDRDDQERYRQGRYGRERSPQGGQPPPDAEQNGRNHAAPGRHGTGPGAPAGTPDPAPTEVFPPQPGGYGDPGAHGHGAQDAAYGAAPYSAGQYGAGQYSAGQYSAGQYGRSRYGYSPFGQEAYGDTAYGAAAYEAAYQDTAYGVAPYGAYPAPDPHGRPPAGRAEGRRHSPALVALVAAAAVAVLALLGGGGYWLFSRDDGAGATDTIAERGGPGSGSGGGASATSPAPCPTPPRFSGASVSSGPDGLVLTTEATASCPDGDIITDDAFTVTATAGGDDVAAGVFDLSQAPIVLHGGESEPVSFVFPAGTYWIPADAVSSPVSVRAEHAGASSPAPQGSGGATGPVTASAPAAPAGGSRDTAALDALRAIAEQSRPAIEHRIAGRWAPQLSSKQNGLVAEGRTWSYSDILDEFLALRRRYPDMVLAWSDDWSTFEVSGWWVMLRGHSEPTADAVLQWCREEDYDRDHCLAKIVSDDRGPEGTTRMQPD